MWKDEVKKVVMGSWSVNPSTDAYLNIDYNRKLKTIIKKEGPLKWEIAKIYPPLVWVFAAFDIVSVSDILKDSKEIPADAEVSIIPKKEGQFLEALAKLSLALTEETTNV